MFVGHLRLMEDTPDATHLVGKTLRTTPHPALAYAACEALRSGAGANPRVGRTGLEPVTSGLSSRRSPS
jgi:hypothetical protein